MLGQALAVLMFLADLALIASNLQAIWYDFVSGGQLWLEVNVRMTAYAALAALLLLATITVAAVCTMNFNRGLKPIFQRSRTLVDTAQHPARHRESHGRGSDELQQLDSRESYPRRMEID